MSLTAKKITDHADEVAAVLDIIADITDMKAARVAEVVVAGVRAAIGILDGLDDGTLDSRDVHDRVAALRDELKTNDAKHDAALAARFPADKFDVGGTD